MGQIQLTLLQQHTEAIERKLLLDAALTILVAGALGWCAGGILFFLTR